MIPAIPTYCTNVHAGRTLEETEANLDRFAVRVRELTAKASVVTTHPPATPNKSQSWGGADSEVDMLCSLRGALDGVGEQVWKHTARARTPVP